MQGGTGMRFNAPLFLACQSSPIRGGLCGLLCSNSNRPLSPDTASMNDRITASSQLMPRSSRVGVSIRQRHPLVRR